METTIVCWGYIGIMKKKILATVQAGKFAIIFKGLYYIGVYRDNRKEDGILATYWDSVRYIGDIWGCSDVLKL